MDKITYPTGVENHGGSLRIWFNFKGKRVRENLGVLTPLRTGRSPGNCGCRYALPSAREALIMLNGFQIHLTLKFLGWARKKSQ